MKLLAPSPGWTARADVIVVGSGIAGLTTALQCRTYGLSVLLVTKASVDEGSTKWAQGGIAAALGALINQSRTTSYLLCPQRIRTRVTAVKGRCPRPLDDGDV
jgi:glycine/D-amino acid oxidase-like deaminating enzyme